MRLKNFRLISVVEAKAFLKDLTVKSLNGELTDSRAMLSRRVLGHSNDFIKVDAGVYGELLGFVARYDWQCNFEDLAGHSLRVAVIEKYIMEDF